MSDNVPDLPPATNPLLAARLPSGEPGWYYAQNRQKIGPLPIARMQELLANGQLQLTDMVLSPGSPQWVQAAVVPELFPPPSDITRDAIPAIERDDQEPVSGENGALHPATRSLPKDELPLFQPREEKHFTLTLSSPDPVYPRIPGYEILGELGRGGMGVVYKAWQSQLKRMVALKMILSGSHAGVEDLARFRTEAEAVARLTHPNIVQIHEIGEQDGLPYFSLEFVEGGNLARQLDGRPGPVRVSAALVETLARAVHYAHQRGVLHRDLKPANVLLQMADYKVPIEKNQQKNSPSANWTLQFAVPKITDFGLAKRLDSEVGLTLSGFVLGTPSYMAPEQASGHKNRLGPGVDIYALGVILYELLTGRPPFCNENTIDMLVQVVSEEPVPPSRLRAKVPVDLETICLKCLQKEPAKRYASAEELADDLRRFLNHEPIQARAIGRAERLWRWCRRKPALAGLTATLVLVVIGAFGLVTWKWRAEVEQRQLVQRSEDNLRRHLYVSNLNLAAEAYNLGQIARAVELLERHQPQPGQPDLRGFEWHCLWGQCHEEKDVRANQPDKVTAVAYAPDGQTLASACHDGTVVMWDASTLRERFRLTASKSPRALAFAPDGKVLAVGCAVPRTTQGEIQLWDVDRQQRKSAWAGAGVFSLAFAPDGKTLVAGSWTNQVKLWDVATGQARPGLPEHKDSIWSVAFAANGRYYASGGEDHHVRVWDAITGRNLQTFQGHTQPVWALAFAPDSKWLASAGDDRSIRLWKLSTGQLDDLFPTEDCHVTALAFAPDGRSLAAACIRLSQNGQVRLLDLNTRRARILQGHTDRVAAVAFAPDGQTLVSGSHDRSLRVWDASLTPPWNRSAGHHHPVPALALSPDGQTLATGSWDRTVKLWDLTTGRVRLTLQGHTDKVLCVAFAPDGQTLVSGGADQQVRLWDPATGKEKGIWSQPGSITALTFSPNGQSLAAGMVRKFMMFDFLTGKPRANLNYPGRVTSLAYTPDSEVLAIGGESNSVFIYDLPTDQVKSMLLGHTEEARCVAISRDGQTLATGSQDRTLKLWDRQTGKERSTIRGQGDAIVFVAFGPDGKSLFSGSGDQTIKRWNIGSRKLTGTIQFPPEALVDSLIFSRDGKTMYVGCADGQVLVWDATHRQARLSLGRPQVYSLAIARDGRVLASVDHKDIKLWDLVERKERATLTGHTLAVQAVAISPDGKTVASVEGSWPKSPAGVVKLWDMDTGQERATLKGHGHGIFAVAFSPDGNLLASAGGQSNTVGEVKLWDVATGRERANLIDQKSPFRNYPFRAVAFSPDGRTVAAASGDIWANLGGEVGCWNVSTGQALFPPLSGHGGPIRSLAFAPDGRTLATGSQDHTVRLWDPATGQERGTLSGHTNGVLGLAFTPDSRRLASTSLDRTVKWWDVETRVELATFKGLQEPAWAVVFSADGRLMVTGGNSVDKAGGIRMWHAQP